MDGLRPPKAKKLGGTRLLVNLVWLAVFVWVFSNLFPKTMIDLLKAEAEKLFRGEWTVSNTVPSVPQPPTSDASESALPGPAELIKEGRAAMNKLRGYQEAESLFSQARILAEPSGKTGKYYIEATNNLITVLAKQRKFDQAIPLMESYRDLLETQLDVDGKRLFPSVYLRFARVYRSAGQYGKAVDAVRVALEKSKSNARWRKNAPPYLLYLLMAEIYRDWGRKDEMEIYARLALDALNEEKGLDPNVRKKAWRRLQQLLNEQNKSPGAIEREA